MPRLRRVLILAVDGAQSLDVMGPVEALETANAIAVSPAYRVEVVTPRGRSVRLSNGLTLSAAPLLDPPPRHDTLLIAGGVGARAAVQGHDVVDWSRPRPGAHAGLLRYAPGPISLPRPACSTDGARRRTGDIAAPSPAGIHRSP